MKNLYFEKNKDKLSYAGQYTYETSEYIIVYEGEMLVQNIKLTPEAAVEYLANGGDLSCVDGLYTFIAYNTLLF